MAHQWSMRLPTRKLILMCLCPILLGALEDMEAIPLVLLEQLLITINLGQELQRDSPLGLGFDEFNLYENPRDRAVVAKYQGNCYLVFQSSTIGNGDFLQNLMLGVRNVCGENGCCAVRRGYWKAWNNDFRAPLEEELRGCISRTCPDSLDCAIFGGHSQGAAVAAVAGLDLADLNPQIITTGMPTAIQRGCSDEFFDKHKFVRFINTRVGQRANGNEFLVYDPVPMAPGVGLTKHYGHVIVISDGGLASLGYNAQARFQEWDLTLGAHWITSGYEAHLVDIVEAHVALGLDTVSVRGYVPGSICNIGVECEAGSCVSEEVYLPRYCTETASLSAPVRLRLAAKREAGVGLDRRHR